MVSTTERFPVCPLRLGIVNLPIATTADNTPPRKQHSSPPLAYTTATHLPMSEELQPQF